MSELTVVSQEQQIASIPFTDLERMAGAIAKSGLFGVKNKDQALALMLLSQAEGRHPVLAARDYHIISGSPALKSDTMLARFQQVGGVVNWTTFTDTEVIGVFSHPSSPPPVEIKWTIEMAAKASLTNNPSWKNYPRAMLRARAVSEGVRTVHPGCLSGMYTEEETESFTSPPDKESAQKVVAEVIDTPKIEVPKAPKVEEPATPELVTHVTPPVPEAAPYDPTNAVNKIFAVLPDDNVTIHEIVTDLGVVIPDCDPSSFRAVLAACLADLITGREQAVLIYKALGAAQDAEPVAEDA